MGRPYEASRESASRGVRDRGGRRSAETEETGAAGDEAVPDRSRCGDGDAAGAERGGVRVATGADAIDGLVVAAIAQARSTTRKTMNETCLAPKRHADPGGREGVTFEWGRLGTSRP